MSSIIDGLNYADPIKLMEYLKRTIILSNNLVQELIFQRCSLY